MRDYGKLAEQYGSFLVAIGGVSITVLTLVLAMWHLKPESGEVSENAAEAIDKRATLIMALIIAMFCSFVGAHLMAETAAFVALQPKGFGARQFLFASVNIYFGVTALMFAVMLLATKYKKENPKVAGIRIMSIQVFRAVVLCELLWMGVSIFFRMPPQQRLWAVMLFVAIIAIAPWLVLRRWGASALLSSTFGLIVVSTIGSLGYSSYLLGGGRDDKVKLPEAIFFVCAIGLTCFSSLFMSERLRVTQTPPGNRSTPPIFFDMV